MTRHRRWSILAVLLSLVYASASADETSLESATAELLRQTQANQIDDAIVTARSIAAMETGSIRSIAALVQLARQLDASGQRLDDAADVHDFAAYAVTRLPASESSALPVAQKANLLLAAANCLTRAGRHADAARWLTSVAGSGQSTPHLATTALSVAAGLLDNGDLENAAAAYQIAIQHGSDNELATARLGKAWCVTMIGQDNDASLRAIHEFLTNHPNHADAASALLLQMTCHARAGQTDAANESLSQLIANHGLSDACTQAIVAHCQTHPLGSGTPELNAHLIDQADRLLALPSFRTSTKVTAMGLVASAQGNNANAERLYADALAIDDATGDVATAVLEHFSKATDVADAQRVAMHWISPNDLDISIDAGEIAAPVITAGVRESACRWAGRTSNWSMLAMAAKEEEKRMNGDASSAQRFGRNLHVQRLFAEALLQNGEPKESLKWWQRIVDEGGADDFPTLLRLAETAASSGSIPEATRRIAAAKAAVTSSAPESALVNLLAADVEVRQLNFDRGRALLESVVRLGSADEDARGRAQWMIGETYFMQEKFSEAIDAYRLVEGISGDGQWTAAALVQAGKSFEKLGRTRDAAVCYSTLVRRFADSHHATGARRRLAALTPDASSPESTLRR